MRINDQRVDKLIEVVRTYKQETINLDTAVRQVSECRYLGPEIARTFLKHMKRNNLNASGVVYSEENK